MAFAASTKPRDAKRSGGGELVAFPMADGSSTAVTIYKGDMVILTIATGYVSAMNADNVSASGDLFAGVAAETKTNTLGAGLTTINVYVTGTFEFTVYNDADTLAVTDLGKEMYADTVAAKTGSPAHVRETNASANDLKVGRLLALEAGAATTARKVRVRIDGYAGCLAACAGS